MSDFDSPTVVGEQSRQDFLDTIRQEPSPGKELEIVIDAMITKRILMFLERLDAEGRLLPKEEGKDEQRQGD